MRPSALHPAPDERGFILVGVVTFMLALTILGLSLFALSSYEAQFFVASATREQSLQNSESGMELVKALISAPGARLENAHRAEGQMGITHAFAYQWRSPLETDTTSTGPVNWDSTLVMVVAAKSGSVERTLQARFIPGVVENPYQRLLTAGQGISVNTSNSTNRSTMRLSGRVWQPVTADADTAWTEYVDWNTGRPIERGMPPTPLTDVFVADYLPGAKVPDSHLDEPDNYKITFNGLESSPTFFKSPHSPSHADGDREYDEYTFYTDAALDLDVKGIAVWVIPEGAFFKNVVKVHAVDGTPSTLVIVAEPNGRDPAHPDRGIWFKGGLDVTGENVVKVYLVSRGDISIVHKNDENHEHDAHKISIVAGGVIEIGGTESGDSFDLRYDPSSMDAIADDLLARGALPQVAGGSGANFVMARQSWLETTPQ
jgi:hypothetical protein